MYLESICSYGNFIYFTVKKSNLDTINYKQVACLHANYIGTGFLSSLGIGFLSLLYHAIDECGRAKLFVHRENGNIVGFVSASEGMRPIYMQLLKHLPTLIIELLPVLCSYTKLRKTLELLLRPKGHGADQAYSNSPELLSIVVDAAYQGSGVAQGLYKQLVEFYVNRGKHGFFIVVGKELHAAHKFYVKCGAIPKAVIQIHKGEDSILYWQPVS